MSNFISALSGLSGSNLSMILLLTKATVILLLALGMTIVMQRASAGSRHLVWLVTVAALLFVPALTAWAPLPLRVLPAVKSIAKEYSPLAAQTSEKSKPAHSATGAVKDGPVSASFDANSAAAASGNSIGSTSGYGIITGLSVVFLIWAAVVLLIAASLGYAALMVKHIVNRARPLDSPDWLNPLWEVSDRLALEQPPRLLRSEDAKMPFACGLMTPTIVLPAESDNWSLERRHAVLLHELAHVRRHDLVGHTLGRLACAIYWFHPLVWTAAKQLRSESERACDDLALACGARATDYAEHLLDIVTSVRGDATPSVALAMARRKEFEGRVLAILDPDLRHSSPSRKQSATLIGTLALISLVVGAAAPAPRKTIATSAYATVIEPAKSAKEYQLLPPAHADQYPSSAETRGDIHSHTEEHTTMTQTQSAVTSMSKTLATVVAQTVGSVVSPEALVNALTRNAPHGAQKDSDERPVLLAKVLSTDTSAALRRVAAWGLNEYADTQVATQALSNALRHDSDARVREMAAWSLAEAGRSGIATEALSAALRGDADVNVRETSAWALGSAEDRAGADALTAALSDASPEVRKRAAWALGSADVRVAPPALIALLKDKDPEVRELAAWSLYQIEDPAAIPALQTALSGEQDKDLQIAYIKALASMGEKSVEALKGLLESRDPEVKSIAVRALAGGDATGPWPWPWPEPRPYP
jgi:beta-lactamase regulating signal transducer with metallopeptidase domain